MRSNRRRWGMAVVGGATMLLASMAGAGPARAKGPESVTIAGPGLDRPIEIGLSGPAATQDETPLYLVIALTELADPWSDAEAGAGRSTEPPPERLGDRYTLTWQMSRPPDADPADYTVVQEIYPDAQFGALLRTRPGGWQRARPGLDETLAALGVPVSGFANPLAAPARPAEPATAAPPLGWLALAAATGLLAGAGLGATLLARRQAREQRQRPPEPAIAAP